jgi:peptidoglycan-N-acetylmuramic acid deacetylase
MLLEPAEQVQAKKKLSDYSTRTYCWGLGQNTRHQKPAGSGPRGWKLKKYNAYYVGPHSKKDKVVYLSFDCGYEAGYTKRILNTLKKYKVKAIFFCHRGLYQRNTKTCEAHEEGRPSGRKSYLHPSSDVKTGCETAEERDLTVCSHHEETYRL